MSAFEIDPSKPKWDRRDAMRPAPDHRPALGSRCLIACALALAACVSAPPDETNGNTVVVAPGVSLRLPIRPDPGRRIEAHQLVEIRHEDRIFAIESRISIDAGRFRMVALDALGRRALTLTWSESGIDAEVAPWVPDTFDVRNLLADLVVIYWPSDAVRTALVETGARWTADRSGRSIYSNGEEVIHVAFLPPRERAWSGMTRYVNRGRGYSIELRSEELTP